MKFSRKKFARLQAFRLLRYSDRLQKAEHIEMSSDDIEWLERHMPIFDEFHLVEAIVLIHRYSPEKGEELARRYRNWVAPSLQCVTSNILGEEP